tara:strand:+ start:540 stop:815 length:276 start_codon:yes stop_codon:yes gene_type:complete
MLLYIGCTGHVIVIRNKDGEVSTMKNPVLAYSEEVQTKWRDVGFPTEEKIPMYGIFEGQHRADIQRVRAEGGATHPFEIGIRCQVLDRYFS